MFRRLRTLAGWRPVGRARRAVVRLRVRRIARRRERYLEWAKLGPAALGGLDRQGRAAVRTAVRNVAMFDQWEERQFGVLVGVVVVAVVLSVVLLQLKVPRFTWLSTAGVVSSASFLVGLAATWTLTSLFERIWGPWIRMRPVVAASLNWLLVVGFLCGCLALFCWLDTLPRPRLTLVLCGGVAATVGPLVVVAVSLVRRVLWQVTAARFFPDWVVADKLLQCLIDFPPQPDLGAYFALRLSLARDLEIAAAAVEHGLRRRLSCGDADTAAWWRTVCGEVAAALRAKKRLVLMWPSDVTSQMRKWTLAQLALAARGRWESMDREKPPARPPEAPKAQILRAARSLGIAFVPLALLYAAQRMLQLPDDTALGYAKLTAIVWAIVSVLGAIDPALDSKAAFIRDWYRGKGGKEPDSSVRG